MIKIIRVLGRKHKLSWNCDPKKLKDAWGDYDPNTLEIRIAKAPLLQQQEALLHELMHAIEEQYGFEMDHDHLTLQARGIIMILRDNPKLHKVLFGDTT